MKRLQRVLAAGLMAAACAATIWAQTDVTTTRVSGTVSAEDGSVLPGVAITATNLETGLVATATTDSGGFYRLLNLPTGNYSILAALEGFATSSRADVRLVLASTPTIDFTMQVSAIVETIDVTSEIPVIEVTNTSTSTTVLTEQIEKMPLAARDFRNLVLLTPQTRFDSERGNLAISGQRGINTNVTIDGVDFNNALLRRHGRRRRGPRPALVSQESIKEFSVITNGASVEFGRSGGGFVNVVTKSGGNSLHGSAFYYNQPQSLIADFANGTEPADQEKDAVRRLDRRPDRQRQAVLLLLLRRGRTRARRCRSTAAFSTRGVFATLSRARLAGHLYLRPGRRRALRPPRLAADASSTASCCAATSPTTPA